MAQGADRAAEGGTFPAEELTARRAEVGRRLAAEGPDAGVVLAPETQLWLCGLDSFISGVLPQALECSAETVTAFCLVRRALAARNDP